MPDGMVEYHVLERVPQNGGWTAVRAWVAGGGYWWAYLPPQADEPTTLQIMFRRRLASLPRLSKLAT